MAKMTKMLVVTNSDGKIIAAAHRGVSSETGQSLAITPLSGQTVHEVEVPESIARLSGRDFHFFISRASFEFGAGKLTFPPIRIKRSAHTNQ